MFSSILTNPMKRGIVITPGGWWWAGSRPYVERRVGASTSTLKVFSQPASARCRRPRPHGVRGEAELGEDPRAEGDVVRGTGGEAGQPHRRHQVVVECQDLGVVDR